MVKKDNILNTIAKYKELEEKDGNYYLLAHELGKVIVDMEDEKSRDILFSIVKKWDSSSNVNSIVGDLIEKRINDPELLFGFYPIHNISLNVVEDENLVELFNYGYTVSHSNKLVLPSDFIILDDIVEAFMLIKTRYSNSKGFVVFSFPKKYFSRKRNLLEEGKYDFYKILKRKYIMYNTYFEGYIEFTKDGCQYYERGLFKERK